VRAASSVEVPLERGPHARTFFTGIFDERPVAVRGGHMNAAFKQTSSIGGRTFPHAASVQAHPNAMIWSLQILRFVAALMVVYVHAAQVAVAATGSSGLIPLEIAIMGRSGVDIFFVLSGVVITRTAQGLTASQFSWRRLRRIMPIYLVCCVPAFLIAAKIGFGWREVLATLLLWPVTDVMTEPLIPVAWTLCFEMLFYVSMALILVDRRWRYVLLGFYALAFLLRPLGPLFQFLGNPLVVEFLFGVAIARASMWRPAMWAVPLGFAALALAGPLHVAPTGGSMDFLTGQEGVQRVLVYGLPAALIVYGAMQIKARESVWTYLGDASYTLYLVHTFVVSALLTLWIAVPLQPDLIIAATMAAAVIFAWRVYERVEKPLLRALPSSLRRSSRTRVTAFVSENAAGHEPLSPAPKRV
jgi:exopolysaccharide production protein ExoZ